MAIARGLAGIGQRLGEVALFKGRSHAQEQKIVLSDVILRHALSGVFHVAQGDVVIGCQKSIGGHLQFPFTAGGEMGLIGPQKLHGVVRSLQLIDAYGDAGDCARVVWAESQRVLQRGLSGLEIAFLCDGLDGAIDEDQRMIGSKGREMGNEPLAVSPDRESLSTSDGQSQQQPPCQQGAKGGHPFPREKGCRGGE